MSGAEGYADALGASLECVLMTQLGHRRLGIAAAQNGPLSLFRRLHCPAVISAIADRRWLGPEALGEAMLRRNFIKGIAGSAAAWPFAARAAAGPRLTSLQS